MLLTSRKLLQRKLLDVESDLRGTLRNFGLKVGSGRNRRFEARIKLVLAMATDAGAVAYRCPAETRFAMGDKCGAVRRGRSATRRSRR